MRKANALGDEIEARKAQQTNLADEVVALRMEINKKSEAVHRLMAGLREAGDYRRGAQDLGEIVESITCKFIPTGK